jgi:predicted dehydrogenase
MRTAVIGVGHLGRHHARILPTLSGVSLAAAVDLDSAKATAAATPHGAEALSDYRQLAGRVDAVVVAVPTIGHLEVAKFFLERGVAVLVEKPMTATLAEAETMLAAAKSGGAVLAVGHTERFNPAIRAIAPIIKHPRFIEVHRLSGFPERSLDIDVVFDVMIHDLDIILSLDASGVKAVDAIGVPVLTPHVDIANVRVTFNSGCVANITASRISKDKIRKVRFFQPDMYVSVDYGSKEAEVWRLVRGAGPRPSIEGGPLTVEPAEPLALELADFIGAVRDRRPPTVPGDAGYRALELATRVAAAIRAS